VETEDQERARLDMERLALIRQKRCAAFLNFFPWASCPMYACCRPGRSPAQPPPFGREADEAAEKQLRGQKAVRRQLPRTAARALS